MADDRDRLIMLYKQLQSIQVPNFDNPEVDITANTIMEGLKLMQEWLVKEAQKHFTKK